MEGVSTGRISFAATREGTVLECSEFVCDTWAGTRRRVVDAAELRLVATPNA